MKDLLICMEGAKTNKCFKTHKIKVNSFIIHAQKITPFYNLISEILPIKNEYQNQLYRPKINTFLFNFLFNFTDIRVCVPFLLLYTIKILVKKTTKDVKKLQGECR